MGSVNNIPPPRLDDPSSHPLTDSASAHVPPPGSPEQRTSAVWKVIVSIISAPVHVLSYFKAKIISVSSKISAVVSKIFSHWKNETPPVQVSVKKADPTPFKEILQGIGVSTTEVPLESEGQTLMIPSAFERDLGRAEYRLKGEDEAEKVFDHLSSPQTMYDACQEYLNHLTPQQFRNFALLANQATNSVAYINLLDHLLKNKGISPMDIQLTNKDMSKKENTMAKNKYCLTLYDQHVKLQAIITYRIAAVNPVTIDGKKYSLHDEIGFIGLNTVIIIPKNELDRTWGRGNDISLVAPQMMVTDYMTNIVGTLEEAKDAVEIPEAPPAAEFIPPPPSYESSTVMDDHSDPTSLLHTPPPEFDDNDFADIPDEDLPPPPFPPGQSKKATPLPFEDDIN